MTKPDVTLTADELQALELLVQALQLEGDARTVFWVRRRCVMSALAKMRKQAMECAT